MAMLGILPLAGAISGYFVQPLGVAMRSLLLVSAALALFPGRSPWLGDWNLSLLNLAGVSLLLLAAVVQSVRARRPKRAAAA
jgi:hypothetical protein